MSLELFINSGSITEIDLSRIDGVRFEDAFSVSSTSCASLYYNVQDFSIPPITPPGVLNIPQTNYFMFDENASSDWDATTPTKIRISLKALGKILDRTNYQQKLFDIIKNRRVDSEITFTKQSTSGDSFKKFKVIDANYLERSYDESGQKFYSFEWGGSDLTETADFFGIFDYLPSSEDGKDGFFTLTVEQIDSGVNTSEPPTQGDELLICITPSAKYGFLDVVDANFDNLNIDNVDVISGSMDVLEVSSSIKINGEILPNVFGITPKPIDSTTFRFSETTWNYDNVFYGIVGSIPSEGYFMFDQDSSINGEYGDSQWRNSKPKNIRINLKSFDNSLESDTVFKNKLFDILKNNYAGSKISFYQQVNNDIDVQAYKEFEIESMFYVEKRIIDGVPYYYEILWGEKDFRETEDRGYFDGNIDKLDTALSDKNTTGFFEIKVKQTNPNITRTYTTPPFQGQDFKVILDVKVIPSKEITFITESRDYVVPAWAKKITIYAVGAGGGGGAGSNGFGHHPGMGLYEDSYIDQTSGERIYDPSDYNERFSTPEFLEKIGHEVVTGGGGGAGGSVVIAEYDIKDALLDTSLINAEITRMQQRFFAIQNIYAQQQLYLETDGAEGLYTPEEEVKVLMDEATKLNADIKKLQIQLDQDTGGIPANSTLTVLVGSPGKGGKGRRDIEDCRIDQELIESNISGVYGVINYTNQDMWKSLWFQREFPRIPQKNNAIKVYADLAEREKTFNEMASTLIGNFLMGKVVFVSLAAIGSLISRAIENGGPDYLFDYDKLADTNTEAARLRWMRYMRQKYGSELNAAKQFWTGEYFEYYQIMTAKYQYSVNEWIKFENSIIREKVLSLTDFVSKLDLSNVDFLLGTPNTGDWLLFSDAIKKFMEGGYGNDPTFQTYVLLDIINQLNLNIEALHDIATRLQDIGVNSGIFFSKIGLDEYIYLNQYEITSHQGRNWYEFYVGSRDYTFRMVNEKVLEQFSKETLGIKVGEFVYADLLKSDHIGTDFARVYDYAWGTGGVNEYNIIRLLQNTVGFTGASFLIQQIPQITFVIPFLSSIYEIGANIIDALTDNEAIAKMKIPAHFGKFGLRLSDTRPPQGLDFAEPITFLHLYESIRRSGRKFYNSIQYHSIDNILRHGKNGGNTEIYLNNTSNTFQTTECILRASGGIGGSGGYSYRAVLNPLARSLGGNFDAYSSFVVPGGYGPVQIPFSKRSKSSTLVNGGPGAYGTAGPTLTNWSISMPDNVLEAYGESKEISSALPGLEAEYEQSLRENGSDPLLAGRIEDLYARLQELSTIIESAGNTRIKFGNFSLDEDVFKANVAISVPLTLGTNNSEYDYYSTPILRNMPFYGKSIPSLNLYEKNSIYQIDGFIHDMPPGLGIGVVGSSDKLNLEGYKKVSETPMPAPPGGGGGCGISWQIVDRRDTKVPYHYSDTNPNRFDQYKLQSQTLCEQIYLGLGGKVLLGNSNTNHYLFKDVDPTTGELVELEIKNGGNGGFGEYYTTDGIRIHARKQVENKSAIDRYGTDLSVVYELPENVSDRWGVGGGGGAAHYETNWDDRPLVSTFGSDPSDPDPIRIKSYGSVFYDIVQDGADGGPGVVVIVAEP